VLRNDGAGSVKSLINVVFRPGTKKLDPVPDPDKISVLVPVPAGEHYKACA